MADFDYEHLVKTLMLGDSLVGKTSLVRRFCEDRFDASVQTTIGVDFRRKDLERHGVKIRMQVWDTAGQERFKTITHSYYKSAGSVLVCFSVSERHTFEGVSAWLEQIKEHGSEDVRCVLVANKIDLPDREVSKEEGMELAQKHCMDYFEVSAKTGENVDKPFLRIIDLLTQDGSAPKQSQGVSLDSAGKKSGKQCAC